MRRKYLYGLLISWLLTGCGGFVSGPPAPVHEPAQSRSPTPAPPVAAAKPAPAPAPAAVPPARNALEQSEMLFQVLSSIGVDYKYGGASHVTGFDCSGLVVHVFREGYGVVLPRNAQAQSQAGRAVSAEELQPGDLVFYNTLNRPFSHVGIYLGEGKFIHAPRTGAAVRIESLRSAYWSRRWNGARRIALQM